MLPVALFLTSILVKCKCVNGHHSQFLWTICGVFKEKGYETTHGLEVKGSVNQLDLCPFQFR